MYRKTAHNEITSWRNSLREMYITLNDSDIPNDSGVAIEYNIPQTNKRIDFLISGYNTKGTGNVLIIELKQWEKIDVVDGQDGIVETFVAGKNSRATHPSYQAWSYATLIKDYNEFVQKEEIDIKGVQLRY